MQKVVNVSSFLWIVAFLAQVLLALVMVSYFLDLFSVPSLIVYGFSMATGNSVLFMPTTAQG